MTWDVLPTLKYARTRVCRPSGSYLCRERGRYSGSRPRCALTFEACFSLDRPFEQPAEQCPREPDQPPRQHVGRVVHAKIHARDADEPGEEHRKRHAVDLRRPAIGHPHQERAERQVHGRRRHRVTARKAERHHLAEVRHDFRARSLKELLQQRVQHPPADARDDHEEGGAPQALQQHESGDRRRRQRRAPSHCRAP